MTPENPLLPYKATLQDVTDLTPDVKLFKVEIDDPEIKKAYLGL